MQTNKLIRYDILIDNGQPELENGISTFLQKCIWSRKSQDQTAYNCCDYGVTSEYVFYDCELSTEDVLCFKLKFGDLAYIAPQIGRGQCRDLDDLFEQITGEPYIHSAKVRKARRDKLLSSMSWLKS